MLLNHPELADEIDEIVAVAGRRPGQTLRPRRRRDDPSWTSISSYDPEGLQVLLDSGVPIVLAPFEIAAKTPLPEADVERFAEVPEIADFFLEPLRDYVNWYDESFGVRAIYPFDTLAVAYLTSPAWIQCDDAARRDPDAPERHALGRGQALPRRRRPRSRARHRVTYCHTADEAFIEDLVRRMLEL